MKARPRAGAGAPLIEVRDLGIFFRLWKSRELNVKDLLLGRALSGGAPVLWALRNVSATFCEGETIGVVGPNGAGKSTLCLALSQILTPDEGSVTVRGDVSTLVGVGAGFNNDLTGRDNIFLNAAFLGIPRRRLEERLDEIIAFSELGDFIDQPIRFYSAGMRSRLGFSVAATLEPDILVLDEVLTFGDRPFRAKSKRRIKEMMRESRLIVIVSHATAFLRGVCTRCLWLEKGRVRALGEAEEVLAAYEAAQGGADTGPDDA